MQDNKLLPIGSIVKLSDSNENLVMIIGRGIQKEEEQYDYVGLLYPYGFTDVNDSGVFNRNNIKEVIFTGYVNEVEQEVREKIEEALDKEQIKDIYNN